MDAWILDQFDGIANIHRAEIADPIAGPGEVLMAVRYAGLNPADRYLAEGQYPARPPLPHVLGRDAMGAIAALGPGVHGLKVGDRRCILRGDVGVTRSGTFAERVAVPVQSLVELPAGWDEQQSAGATLVYLTAYQALTQWGELPPSLVLITGASGGVGVASIQLAKAMGHTVAGLSRSPQKQQRLRELGADLTLNPEEKNWPLQLKQSLDGRRVDLAIDNIGGELFSRVIETLGDHGKVSVVGRLAGPVPQFNTASLFFRRLRIGGVAVGAYTNQGSRSAWSQVVQLMASTGAKPLVDHVYPFEQLPQAFRRLVDGPMGKVLLQVTE